MNEDLGLYFNDCPAKEEDYDAPHVDVEAMKDNLKELKGKASQHFEDMKGKATGQLEELKGKASGHFEQLQGQMSSWRMPGFSASSSDEPSKAAPSEDAK